LIAAGIAEPAVEPPDVAVIEDNSVIADLKRSAFL